MGCADNCHGEIPHEPPTFWGSGSVRASLLAWVLVVAGLCAWWAKVPLVALINAIVGVVRMTHRIPPD